MRKQKFYVVVDLGAQAQVEDEELRKFLISVARRIWTGRWPRRPQDLSYVREGTYMVEEVTLTGGCTMAQGDYYIERACSGGAESRRVVLEVRVGDDARRVIVKRRRDGEGVYRVYVV